MRDVDAIILAVASCLPGVIWRQLQVSHPGADDDGIWFFWLKDQDGLVQIESSEGALPFVIETDKHNERAKEGTLSGVVSKVVEWLQM